jgi:predicted metal-binding transcription factor (methanogenesis marker protein 9)
MLAHPIGICRSGRPLSLFFCRLTVKITSIFDPQKSFAQRDEGHHVLDLVGVEILQLDLVVMK